MRITGEEAHRRGLLYWFIHGAAAGAYVKIDGCMYMVSGYDRGQDIYDLILMEREVATGMGVQPNAIQRALLEHLLQTAMSQLNEIRDVVGVPREIPHVELMGYLMSLRADRAEKQQGPRKS